MSECQQAAIDLGNYLESLKDMDYTPMVGILEDYCENIYQLGIGIRDEALCRKLSKKIRKQHQIACAVGLYSAQFH